MTGVCIRNGLSAVLPGILRSFWAIWFRMCCRGFLRLPYLGSDEVDRLVYGVNATDVSYPEGESVVSLFESSAALYGDLPAVVYGDRE
ncbi:hypothetical protein OHD16_27280 [Sphingobacterium sp. ML3W]|uniref:hypothetical protein n=1 Tax=Sphingobacterium sp. ML3W TaxID=1538644 RepID=UPI0030087D34